jgi:hypothetical protein
MSVPSTSVGFAVTALLAEGSGVMFIIVGMGVGRGPPSRVYIIYDRNKK